MPVSPLRGAFRLLDLGLEQSLLDTVKRRSRLDQVAFFELHLVQKTGNPRANFNPTDRLDTANEASRASDRLVCCSDDADWNGGRLLLLGNGRISESKAHESSEKRVSHLGSGVTLRNWAIFDPVRRRHDSRISDSFRTFGKRNAQSLTNLLPF